MAIITSIRNGQGAITKVGTDYVSTGVQEDDLYHIANDFIANAGVLDVVNSFKVTQRAAGANMSVDVSAGTCYVLNSAWTTNDTVDTKYWRVVSDEIHNQAINSNASGNPRIDIVCIKVDTTATPDANASNVATVVVVAGTPGASPVAPATPSNHLKLAEVTVANGATSITDSNISDKRVSLYLAQSPSNGNVNFGMSRQAVINGNMGVWQRGTSTTLSDVTATYLADRWFDYADKNGGTLPTLTRSQQTLTAGDIQGAFYFTRLATNGAGTSLGASSYHQYIQRIEFGTRSLCGANKKVTVSFWARSSIANKRIGITLYQSYGSGGSPSSNEILLSSPISLTSSWAKYTATFTTNTLVGKTFGTNNDDSLQVAFSYMWGTTWGNTNVQAGVTAETYVGSGNIDIAQVQLCSGDVALDFQLKSYEDELRQCQRYYERLEDKLGAFPSDANTALLRVTNYSGSSQTICVTIPFKVTKRATPTTTNIRYDISDGAAATASPSNTTRYGFMLTIASVASLGFVDIHDFEAGADL